jgi:hypothetical protein
MAKAKWTWPARILEGGYSGSFSFESRDPAADPPNLAVLS